MVWTHAGGMFVRSRKLAESFVARSSVQNARVVTELVSGLVRHLGNIETSSLANKVWVSMTEEGFLRQQGLEMEKQSRSELRMVIPAQSGISCQ